LVLILIGVEMLGFILTDMFTSGRMAFAGFNGTKGIGQVFGEEINREEFGMKLQKALQGQAAQNGPDFEITPALEGQVNDQLWNEFVSSRIINKEAANLGLEVTGEEILDLCIGDNPHPLAQQALADKKTGKIDKQLL